MATLVKPLKKPKKKSRTYYQNKADRVFQEMGRSLYSACLLCGGEYSCLHHYIHVSQSTALRYNIKNGIPICSRCHCAIHQGKQDKLTGRIALIKGKEWLDELETIQKNGRGLYYGATWYEEQYNRLKLTLETK